MSAGALVQPLLVKEFRALLPTWAAGIVAIGAAFVSSDGRVLLLAALGYGVAAVALGAQSVGHEYTYGTLGSLLVQPVERRRIFLIKLGVLLALLIVLAAAAWNAPFNTDAWRRPWGWRHPALVLLPAAIALFIAPWMAMVCRSPMAGIVFSATLPGLLMFAGEIIGAVRLGIGHPDVDPAAIRFWLRGLVPLLVVSAFLGWRAFVRLEAIDGEASEIQMPRWFKPDRPASRHPVWLLFWKELHLQQMTFVVVVLFAIGWATLSLLKDLVPAFADAPLVPLTLVYMALLSILIGSLASAEERHLGVLQLQLLLPMAGWQQWMVKVGTALVLALLMGVGVPMLLSYLSPAPHHFDLASRLWQREAVVLIVLTSLSLYISSITTSGVRAVMLAFPVLTVLVGLSQLVQPLRLRATLLFAILALLVPVALWLAYQNHRSADRGLRQIATQLLWFIAVPLGGVVVVAGFVVARMLMGI